MSQIETGKRTYDPDNDFSDNSVMILTLDLETWFKITAHPLPKGTLQVTYEPNWAKGREDMPQKMISDGQMDERTNRWTDRWMD